MTNSKFMTFSIYRFDPDVDKKPRMQDYQLDIATIKGKMLLNALEAIKEKNPDVAFRRSCGEGVCGSDGLNINGTNGLACITRLHDLPDRVVLMPLPGFPVIRDLIVDMEPFFDQYKRVQPFLQNHDKLHQGSGSASDHVIAREATMKERLQSPKDRAKLDGLYECILCACCTSSCPSYWWNPDKFVGPAGLLNAYRFVADSRDTQKAERLDALKDPFSVFRCRTIMNCADVCPKGLNPTAAISKLRQEMISE